MNGTSKGNDAASPVCTSNHEHEVHGPLRAWTPEAGLSNQWFRRFMNIYDMTFRLT